MAAAIPEPFLDRFSESACAASERILFFFAFRMVVLVWFAAFCALSFSDRRNFSFSFWLWRTSSAIQKRPTTT